MEQLNVAECIVAAVHPARGSVSCTDSLLSDTSLDSPAAPSSQAVLAPHVCTRCPPSLPPNWLIQRTHGNPLGNRGHGV